MQTETDSRASTPPPSCDPDRPRPRRRPRRPAALAALALAVAAAGGALSGCGDQDDGSGARVSSSAPASQAQRGTDIKVLWLGDSIAGAEAPPLGAALEASGATFRNASSDGGGTLVQGDKTSAPLARSAWKDLRKNIASFHPDVIAYQITTYDWGTRRQQLSSYRKLAGTAHDAGAELVVVSAPPYKIDDFYRKHTDAIRSAPKAAKEAADTSGGAAHFLDASTLWGTDSTASEAQRAADGIHSCQQGSASFAKWFTAHLGKQYDFTPAAPDEWAQGQWTNDRRYAQLGCD